MNKPVFPLAGTGGDAKRAFDDMVKKGLLLADDKLGSAIRSPGDAREVVDVALARLPGAASPSHDVSF